MDDAVLSGATPCSFTDTSGRTFDVLKFGVPVTSTRFSAPPLQRSHVFEAMERTVDFKSPKTRFAYISDLGIYTPIQPGSVFGDAKSPAHQGFTHPLPKPAPTSTIVVKGSLRLPSASQYADAYTIDHRPNISFRVQGSASVLQPRKSQFMGNLCHRVLSSCPALANSLEQKERGMMTNPTDAANVDPQFAAGMVFAYSLMMTRHNLDVLKSIPAPSKAVDSLPMQSLSAAALSVLREMA